MRRYGKGPGGRMATAAAVRALAVLLRRHPRAAIDMAGAGLWAAGRVGVDELKHWVAPKHPRALREARKRRGPTRLKARDKRRLRKALAEDARAAALRTDLASADSELA